MIMNRIIITRIIIMICIGVLACLSGCEMNSRGRVSSANSASSNSADSNSRVPTTPGAAPDAKNSADSWAITLPVLNSFFMDDAFTGDVKKTLQLSDDQIQQLKDAARRAAEAEWRNEDGATTQGSVGDLRQQATREIQNVLGPENSDKLFALVAERWNGTNPGGRSALPAPGAVPDDSRIVINDPAFRMDVFENGQLVKSYLVGIGYPAFPLPTGVREAKEIIFNPPWTPPDSPWVDEMHGKAQPGKTIKGGDKSNPLGILKVPIGLPSLIHGGKAQAKLGKFASHGCVGLTDAQAADFALLLARIGGADLTEQDISQYHQARTTTKTVKLGNTVPVELRYDTIVVEGGKLRIYPDVYGRGTNTEANVTAALAVYGVTPDQLSQQEREQVQSALSQVGGNDSSPTTPASRNSDKSTRPKKQSERAMSSQRAQNGITIEIAALKGKGYPEPAEIDTGLKVAHSPARKTRK